VTFTGQPQQSAPAGWYQDPAGPASLRYFDGSQWTKQTSPVQSAPPAPWNQPIYQVPVTPVGSDPRDAMHWMLPIGRTGQSIAAGYLGLFGLLIWPLAPFAIGFGIWALAASKRTGLHGRGRAIFGIITGVVGALIGAVVLVSTALSGT
jgi:hypothetical protein